MHYEDSNTTVQDVLAVVVSDGVTPYLPGVLGSIAAQSVRPHRVVVVDVSGDSAVQVADVEPLTDAGLTAQIVQAPKARTFGAAVSAALASLEVSERWLWLFHDDALAHKDSLAAQLRPVEHSSSVSVVGAKQWKLGTRKELINVGYSVSRGGTRFTGIESQEFDQGQHDSRVDVYAVSLNGALVSTALWMALKGTVPTFGKYGDSLDFCRRARLAGHRVIVATDAVVEHAQATFMDVRGEEELPATPSPSVLDDEPESLSFWRRLKSQMLFRVTNRPFFAFLFVWLGILVLAPFRMLYRVFNKSPHKAALELAAPFWLLSQLPAIARIRSRMAQTKAVRPGVLKPLLVTHRQIFDARRNRRLARSALRKKLYGPSELDKRELRARLRQRVVVLGSVIALVAGLSVWVFHGLWPALFSGERLVGGAMLPTAGGWSQLWQHWTAGWIRDGLGASAPSDPLLATLAPIMVLTLGNMQLAANVVMLGSLLWSALGAWFAAGTITRSVTARAWSALLWAAAPSLLFAVEQGRLGAVIAHATLPWLAVAVMRGIGAHKRDARGELRFRHEQRQEQELVAQGVVDVEVRDDSRRSLAAIGGASLLFAVLVSGAPVLLLPGLAIFVGASFARRARALLFVPIPAIAMLGPVLFRGFVNREVGGWRVLFADPGATLGYERSQPWQLLLGIPSKISPFTSSGGYSGILWSVLPYLLGGALIAGALVSLWRRGQRAPQVRGAWWIAALGFAVALLSSSIVVSAGESGSVNGWSGAGVSLMTFGFLAACVLASDEVAAAALERSFGWRQVSLGVATLLVFVVPVATIAGWGSDRDLAHETVAGGEGTSQHLTSLGRSIVPAVAAQMQKSGRAARVLVISPAGAGKVEYQLMHGDGVQLMETSTVVDAAHLTGRPDDIAGLVAHLSRGLEQEGYAASAFQLSQMGVGAVLVPPGDSDDFAQLVGRVDTVAGLQRITENETGTVWRVDPTSLDASMAQGEVSTVVARNAAAAASDGSDAAEQTTVIVAGEPAWAVAYSRASDGSLTDPVALESKRLGVDSTVSTGPERIVVLAENAAPGWRAWLDGKSLQSTSVNGMQAFELPDSSSGHIEIAYERSSRLAWLLLQSFVLVVFGLLAIPVRRKGSQK